MPNTLRHGRQKAPRYASSSIMSYTSPQQQFTSRSHQEHLIPLEARLGSTSPRLLTHLVGENQERCLYCHGTRITREGKRYKKHEVIQRWLCHACNRVFSPQQTKGKTYPLKVILEALMHYYRGQGRRTIGISSGISVL